MGTEMFYEYMIAYTPLPPCMPFSKALAGLLISSTAKVITGLIMRVRQRGFAGLYRGMP